MIELKNIDLRTDPAAQRYVNGETVSVEFARGDGELMSLEGPNRYTRGDALITGSTGERWVVLARALRRKISARRRILRARRSRPVSQPARRRTGKTDGCALLDGALGSGRRRGCTAPPATGSCNMRPATTALFRRPASRRCTAGQIKADGNAHACTRDKPRGSGELVAQIDCNLARHGLAVRVHFLKRTERRFHICTQHRKAAVPQTRWRRTKARERCPA